MEKQTFTGCRLSVVENDIQQLVQQDFRDIADAVSHAIEHLNGEQFVGIQVIAEDSILGLGRVYFDEHNGYGQAVFT